MKEVVKINENNRVLISGDSVQNSNIFMFGPGRNLTQYIESLKHLSEYEDQFDDIYPMHGTFPVHKDLIPKLIQGAQSILDGKAQEYAEPVNMFDMPVIKSCCEYFEMPLPEFEYFDSLIVARRTWPEIKSHQLTKLGEHFGIEYIAHDAL